ncbi:MAG TPA: zinc ABC transporter substrate-binding protein, partial [Candidatus Caenarcaniphilales bacterium]
NPVLAKQQVETIRKGLIAADPKHKAIYQANAASFTQQLEALDNQFKQRLKPYQNRTFITFHDAFSYLAQRYQLKQIAVVEIPEDTLSPADIQKLVTVVKQYEVKAVFGEPGVDNKLLQSLSQDLDISIRALDSLESGSQNPQYYFTTMKANLKTLESAFR